MIMATGSENTCAKEAPSAEVCENASNHKTLLKSGTDDALQMAIDGQDETWTEEEERRVLRKIDMAITPLV
jgi:hypothetical protein